MKLSLFWRLLEHKRTAVLELDHLGAGALLVDWRSKG
jgi:hypothetical protein